MHLWLLLTGSFFIQESISASLIVLTAYKEGYSPLLVTLLWLAAAITEIYIGYFVGAYIKRRFVDSAVERWVLRKARAMTDMVGIRNEKLVLMALTIFTLPVFAAAIGVWLEISFSTIIIWCLIGDFIWYATVWAKVLGTSQFASNIKVASIAIVVLSIASSIVFSIVQKKFRKGR